jgi:hypothetical protein
MHLIKSYFKLSSERKSLLIKSVVLTILIRIFLDILPFSRINPISKKIVKIRIHQKNPKQINDIIWSIMVGAAHVPRSTCLVQAITAQTLMRYYGYDSIVRIGVINSDKFEAHAWLEMDNKIILGESCKHFVPILEIKK